jgi:hypothetical protein
MLLFSLTLLSSLVISEMMTDDLFLVSGQKATAFSYILLQWPYGTKPTGEASV